MHPPRRSTAPTSRLHVPQGLLRAAGAALFVGALLTLFEGLREQEPGILLLALLQAGGWWTLVARANRVEARGLHA